MCSDHSFLTKHVLPPVGTKKNLSGVFFLKFVEEYEAPHWKKDLPKKRCWSAYCRCIARTCNNDNVLAFQRSVYYRKEKREKKSHGISTCRRARMQLSTEGRKSQSAYCICIVQTILLYYTLTWQQRLSCLQAKHMLKQFATKNCLGRSAFVLSVSMQLSTKAGVKLRHESYKSRTVVVLPIQYICLAHTRSTSNSVAF